MKMKNIEIAELKKKLADRKPPKPQHATMSKVMVSKVTNNINAILSTPMSDSMKIKQIQTIIANPNE